MFQDKKSLIISSILLCVFLVGVGFQNCAQPLDPDLVSSNNNNNNSDNSGSISQPSTGTSNSSLDFTVSVFPSEATTSDSIRVAVDPTGGTGNYTYSLKKGTQEISTFSAYLIPPSLSSDVFTMTVSDGKDSITKTIPVTIRDVLNDGSGGGGTGSGGIYLQNIGENLEMNRTFQDGGKSILYVAQRDTVRTSSSIPHINIHWEKKAVLGSSWSYHKSGPDLNITASHSPYNVTYRAVGVNSLDNNHKGYGPNVNVVTKKYIQTYGQRPSNNINLTNSTAANYTCDFPYVVSGIVTGYIKTVTDSKGQCISGESNDCNRYAPRRVYGVKQLVCSLVQEQANANITWLNLSEVGVIISNGGYGTAHCNPLTSDVKTKLLEGISLRDKNVSRRIDAVCAKPALASNKVILEEGARIPITYGDADKTFECPNYRYMTQIDLGNRDSWFVCGRIQ